MASKKTTSKKKIAPKAKVTKKAAPKKAAKDKVEVKAGPRHPMGRVKAQNDGGKEALAKALAPLLATEADDKDTVETRLKTASNQQLLRLQRVADAVKQKWGGRDALITALATAEKKAGDKDYVTKLGTFSLPKLFDLATSAERRARA